MALRVLLADESSTIKKAIQLVLSEFGVEVKTVPTGIDVLAVAQTFLPEIVIADILLNKKNGYEVCLELKNNEATRNIPVVLMWSSFMQLDTQLFQNSKADASLEKPFEAETIKALFEKLVPRLRSFPLKGLLNHAPLPEFEESDTFVRQKNNFNTLIRFEDPLQEDTSANGGTMIIDEPLNLGLDDADKVPKLSIKQKLAQKLKAKQAAEALPVEIKPEPSPSAKQPQYHPPTQMPEDEKAQDPDEWSSAKPNQFVIETENYGDFEEVKVVQTESSGTSTKQSLNEQIRSYLKDSPTAAHNTYPKNTSSSSFDEQLMKEEIRQIAERICWQVIPEITEKIVREELAKLLQGIEKNV